MIVVDVDTLLFIFLFFFFNDTATTEIYTLSLHDALPICRCRAWKRARGSGSARRAGCIAKDRDRKSTRLNSSHLVISYAVFCLKKKKKLRTRYTNRLSTTPLPTHHFTTPTLQPAMDSHLR